jgi:hypothetical protein
VVMKVQSVADSRVQGAYSLERPRSDSALPLSVSTSECAGDVFGAER